MRAVPIFLLTLAPILCSLVEEEERKYFKIVPTAEIVQRLKEERLATPSSELVEEERMKEEGFTPWWEEAMKKLDVR